MKSLDILQTMAKIGKILSKVAFVASVVGAVLSAVGIVLTAVNVADAVKVGGITIHGLIDKSGYDMESLYAIMSAWLIMCIGECVLAHYAARYFENELKSGTPFTLSGAKELLRLGILTAALPIAFETVAKVVAGIVAATLGVASSYAVAISVDNDGAVILGLCFIASSLICRYATELLTEKAQQS